MMLTDSERAELVQELGGVMHSLANDDEALIQLVYTPNDYAEKVLMPIIDRLLADRAVPEPAADMVERAAEAIYVTNQASAIPRDKRWLITPFEELGVDAQERYRDMAYAALVTVPTVQAAAGDNLDAMLDSVQPNWSPGEARIKNMYRKKGSMLMDGDQWYVEIATPGGTGTGLVDEDVWCGTGATRAEALADAVRRAKS